jgi:hypothetical protein
MASCVMATATSFNRFLVSRSSQMAARPKANAHHVNQMNGSTVPANAELLAMEQMPKLWLKITRPRRSSRIKQQSKLQKLFVSALTLAEPLASHNAGSAAF